MEGLQLRSIKLWSKGEPIEEVYRIIENNTRQPVELMGDIAAQLAGCLLGRDVTAQLVDKYGVVTFERAVDTLTLARRRHPGLPNSLDALCVRYGTWTQCADIGNGTHSIRTSQGEVLAVESKLQAISWDGQPASLFTLRRANAAYSAPPPTLQLELQRRLHAVDQRYKCRLFLRDATYG